jgi:hypothetical protein
MFGVVIFDVLAMGIHALRKKNLSSGTYVKQFR